MICLMSSHICHIYDKEAWRGGKEEDGSCVEQEGYRQTIDGHCSVLRDHLGREGVLAWTMNSLPGGCVTWQGHALLTCVLPPVNSLQIVWQV